MPYSQKENGESLLPNNEVEEAPSTPQKDEVPVLDVPEDETAQAVLVPCPDDELAAALADVENEQAPTPDTPAEDAPGFGVQALSFAFDLTELFTLSFVVVIVILCFFLRHSPVSGESMMPTIQHADTLLVSDVGYTPAHGDVVIVQSLHNLEKPLVKRVIAVGGDQIEINFERWMIKVNGIVIEQRLDSNGNPAKIGGDYVYYREGTSMRIGSNDGSDLYKIGFTYDVASGSYIATVPKGHLFILGDNRNDSKDSRDATVGFVDERLVVGKAIYRIAPFSQMGTLD